MTLGLGLGSIGAVMLVTAVALSFNATYGPGPGCIKLQESQTKQQKPPPPDAGVDLIGGNIQLGRPLCLKLERSRFFAKERAALDRQEAAVDAAEAVVAAAARAARTAAEPSKATAPEMRTAADPDVQKAMKTAQQELTEARTALDQLPQRRKIFLFVDRVQVPMQGHEVAIRPAPGESEWALEGIPLWGTDDAASEDGKAWRRILSGPTEGGARKVTIGVAVGEGSDQEPIVRAVLKEQRELRVFELGRVFIGGVGLVLLAAGVAIRGWNTGMLRDGKATTQFSLGRVQIAWWLLLTVGGFLFIYLVSGQWKGVVTAGVVGLLGISASTGVAARLVDTAAADPPSSTSFLTDLVRDGDGAALHRIQLIAWTVILGAIFVWSVVRNFAFPNFDTNLLLLVGIAGGTYVGFKFQEK